MGLMPGRVAKTPGWKKFDKAITKNPAAYLKKYKKDPDPKKFKELIDGEAKDVIDDDTRKHLQEHWLGGGPKPYFPNVPDLGLHVLQGLRWAATLSVYSDKEKRKKKRKKPLPVRTVWICSFPKDSPEFEIACFESDKQVTLMFLTPQPPETVTVTKSKLQPIYTTRRLFEAADNTGTTENWDPDTEELREKTSKMVTIQPWV
jgi:hypothetical protein